MQFPISFGDAWLHPPPARVNSHAAPHLLLSIGAPISAVSPSADRETLVPKAVPAGAICAPVPRGPPQSLTQFGISFAPCCSHAPAVRVNTQAEPC